MVPLWATEGAADMPSPSCGAVIYLCAKLHVDQRKLESMNMLMDEIREVVQSWPTRASALPPSLSCQKRRRLQERRHRVYILLDTFRRRNIILESVEVALCAESTDFRRRVKSYARSDPDNAVSQYWPVVKRIEVSGPFVRLEGIKGDLELSIQLVANGLSAAGSLHFP